MNTSQEGLALIRKYEGLELKAYRCPAGVWTIGYGHTKGVSPKQVIDQNEANWLLANDVQGYEAAVNELVTVPLLQREFDALVSFTFNLGAGSLRQSTLLRRLNAGEDKATVFREELPRWNKGPNGPLLGLTYRRNAEVNLACGQHS